MRPRDALPTQSALAFYAKTLRYAAGRYAGCMAQGAGMVKEQRIHRSSMGYDQGGCSE